MNDCSPDSKHSNTHTYPKTDVKSGILSIFYTHIIQKCNIQSLRNLDPNPHLTIYKTQGYKLAPTHSPRWVWILLIKSSQAQLGLQLSLAYPGVCSMRQLGVLLLPPHIPPPTLQEPFICLGREALWQSCPRTQHYNSTHGQS